MYLENLPYVLGMKVEDENNDKIYSDETSVKNPVNRMNFEQTLGIKRNG